MKIRIYYEDTDAGVIVYHTNYIKYCERARSEEFFSRGIRPLYESSGFVVRDIEASFLATATLGDMIEVRSSMIELKRSSLWLLQEIYKADELIFRMKIKLVYISRQRPIRIPQEYLELFEEL